jgi:hypothetical protein
MEFYTSVSYRQEGETYVKASRRIFETFYADLRLEKCLIVGIS